jgi:PAS domain S-box-containing protein
MKWNPNPAGESWGEDPIAVAHISDTLKEVADSFGEQESKQTTGTLMNNRMKLLARESLRFVHVEDNNEFAEVSKIWLKSAGFKGPIVRCHDGKKAVDYLATLEPDTAPDVILLDFEMPHLNGLEVIKWVRLNFIERDVPVYLLTSSCDPRDRQLAEEAGVTKYFFKTALYDELIQELDRYIAATNRNRPEEAHIRHENMAELILMGEYAAEMVVLTDAEGRVEWVNEAFTRTTGYSLEELFGKKPGRLLQGPGSDHASVRMLHSAIKSVQSCDCEITNYKKNGTPYSVHISLGPVLSMGRLDGFLAVQESIRSNDEALDLIAPAVSSPR